MGVTGSTPAATPTQGLSPGLASTGLCPWVALCVPGHLWNRWGQAAGPRGAARGRPGGGPGWQVPPALAGHSCPAIGFPAARSRPGRGDGAGRRGR